MIRLAIIGTGGMANAHAAAFAEIDDCKIVACADIVLGRAEEFAHKHGIQSAYVDTAEMLEKEKLDAVSVVTPDQHHILPVMMAIDKGLHVMCEKPLATTLKDARAMAEASAARGIITAVNFSYRNRAATQKAAELVMSGAVGRVLHVEGSYLQSWIAANYWGDWRTSPAFLWRMSKSHGSGGVLGDVGVHLYDLVSFVAGDIEEIFCELRVFEKDVQQIDDYVFDANEIMAANVKFASGAIGTLRSSRWAVGHTNTVALAVYGDRGAIDLNLDRPDSEILKACLGEDVDKVVWSNVDCPETPNMYARFVESIRTGVQGQTSFAGAAKVQAYLDASERSAEAVRYVKTGVV